MVRYIRDIYNFGIGSDLFRRADDNWSNSATQILDKLTSTEVKAREVHAENCCSLPANPPIAVMEIVIPSRS